MQILFYLLVGLVALEHLYILWLEMFAWETVGKKAFKGSLPDAMFTPTKTLAANQGLYNGFLAAGLVWAFCIGDTEWQHHVAIFFLSCVIIAGVYGAFTASKKIFFYTGIASYHCPSSNYFTIKKGVCKP